MPRVASLSTVGRIAAARMKAKKRSAASSFSCQSASAATTIPPATSVASAARWAVSFTRPAFPADAIATLVRTCVRALEWSPNGHRRADRPRGPRAQPQGHRRPAAAERPRLHHRAFRVRQVLARVRHDLRRGPAPLRREPLRVRAPVPADDGEARRRLDRRALAGDLDRPEDDLAQPALDGRDGDRDLRLPAPALRARRPSALSRLRPPDRRPEPRPDRRADPGAAGGGEVHGQRADRARPQGRVPRRARRAARRRLHARQGRRRDPAARGGDRPRQEVQARDRRRRRPARAQARPAPAADSVGRDGGGARRRARRDRCRRRRDHALQREVRLPRARRLAARAAAAHLLLQLAARRLSALHRARLPARDRSRPDRPRLERHDRRRRARALVGRERRLLRLDRAGDLRPLRDRPRHALARPHDRAAGPLPARHQGRQALRPVPQPDGAAALVHDGLRGDRLLARAPLQGDRLLSAARADRGVHELPALPDLRRRPAEAGGARGHGRRRVDPPLHAHVGHTRARVPRRARPDPHGGADRPPDREGDPRAADLPRQRRRRLPPARPRGEDPLGRRGPAAAAGDADRLAARRRPLHPRRAVDRPAPARQRQADRDARAAEGARQHRPRRRARRADDAHGRPPRRHGARGGRARRLRGRRGHREGRDAGQGLGHRPVPLGRAEDRDPAAARGGPWPLHRPRRGREQPEAHRRRVPGRRSSSPSPASPAPASRPSSTRSSTRPPRTGSTGCASSRASTTRSRGSRSSTR